MTRKAIWLLLLLLLPVLASDISGTWDFTVETSAGTGNPVFVFQQQGDKLTGTYKGLLGEAKVTGTVKGDKVEFSLEGEYGGEKMKVEYAGTIESPVLMKGTVRLAGLGEGTWTAKKK
jgi:hypothetical protein